MNTETIALNQLKSEMAVLISRLGGTQAELGKANGALICALGVIRALMATHPNPEAFRAALPSEVKGLSPSGQEGFHQAWKWLTEKSTGAAKPQ